MTEKEAIEVIRDKACNDRCEEIHCNDACMYGKDKCAFDMAIQALEKQMPKKPYIQQVEIDYYEHDCMECPSCDSFLGYASECKEEHYQENYCPNCGQRLDWGE